MWNPDFRFRGVTVDLGKAVELEGARASGSGLSRGTCCIARGGGVAARNGSNSLVFCSKKLLKNWVDSSCL